MTNPNRLQPVTPEAQTAAMMNKLHAYRDVLQEIAVLENSPFQLGQYHLGENEVAPFYGLHIATKLEAERTLDPARPYEGMKSFVGAMMTPDNDQKLFWAIHVYGSEFHILRHKPEHLRDLNHPFYGQTGDQMLRSVSSRLMAASELLTAISKLDLTNHELPAWASSQYPFMFRENDKVLEIPERAITFGTRSGV